MMKRPKTGNRPPLVCAGGRENNLGGSVSPRAQLFFAGCLCVVLVASIVGLPRDIHRVDIARWPCCDFGVGLGQSSLRNKETSPACVGSFGNGHVAEPLGTANPPPRSLATPHPESQSAKDGTRACAVWNGKRQPGTWACTSPKLFLRPPAHTNHVARGPALRPFAGLALRSLAWSARSRATKEGVAPEGNGVAIFCGVVVGG